MSGRDLNFIWRTLLFCIPLDLRHSIRVGTCGMGQEIVAALASGAKRLHIVFDPAMRLRPTAPYCALHLE